MRIAFLCGSQEAGRDGVGDYTAGLAEELQQQGHEVIVIGLRDKFAGNVTSTERHVTGGSIQVLRLPSALAWPECIEQARQQLDRFDPEWVSLQFVCYTFHPKGLIHGLAGKLAPLLTGRKLHVMFHEIWLCKELGWDWKQCTVGTLQRLCIQRFIGAAGPAVMHTSNATYAALLNRSGIPVTELGLFGAIPIPPEPGKAWVESQLRAVLGGEYHREGSWLFGLFGALHAQWPPEPLLTRLHRAAQAAGKRPVLLSIGRTGDAGLELWNRMVHDHADRFTFIRLGEQPAEHVSEYLSFLDCGIATTPRSIIGKSSTVISMLEHGLSVIVNRDDTPGITAPPPETEPLLISGDRQLEARLQTGFGKGPCGSRRARIAKDLLNSLQAAGGPCTTPDSAPPAPNTPRSHNTARRLRLMFVLTHPIQHYAKWCRALGAEPAIDFEVFYAYRQDTTFDPGFRRTYKWDIDLYSGYQSHTGPAFAPLKSRLGWWLLLFPRPLFEVFRHDCALMLGFTTFTGILMLLLKPLHRTKIVLRQDSANYSIRTRGFFAWGKRTVYRLLMKSVDTLLTQGIQNSNYFEYYGLPRDRHVLVPVIVDEEIYKLPSPEEREQLRAQYAIAPEQVVFIVSGKFERRKRADFAIRAFSKHARRNENSLLWLVGSGEMDEELRALVGELGIGSRVLFHGFVLQRQMSELYKAADCLVHVARFDPWPICVLEGIHCGLAVILSSSVGSVDDIIQPGVTGFRFDQGNEAALIQQLDLLSSDRGLIGTTAAACREHMSTHQHEKVMHTVVQACLGDGRGC